MQVKRVLAWDMIEASVLKELTDATFAARSASSLMTLLLTERFVVVLPLASLVLPALPLLLRAAPPIHLGLPSPLT